MKFSFNSYGDFMHVLSCQLGFSPTSLGCNAEKLRITCPRILFLYGSDFRLPMREIGVRQREEQDVWADMGLPVALWLENQPITSLLQTVTTCGIFPNFPERLLHKPLGTTVFQMRSLGCLLVHSFLELPQLLFWPLSTPAWPSFL